MGKPESARIWFFNASQEFLSRTLHPTHHEIASVFTDQMKIYLPEPFCNSCHWQSLLWLQPLLKWYNYLQFTRIYSVKMLNRFNPPNYRESKRSNLLYRINIEDFDWWKRFYKQYPSLITAQYTHGRNDMYVHLQLTIIYSVKIPV